MKNDILGFLGILFRAHRLLIGEEAHREIKKGRYGFIASDASANSMKDAKNACDNSNVPYSFLFTKEELGGALGYENVSFALVSDKKAAEKLAKLEKETVR